MRALRRNKTRNGESAVSAKALSLDDLYSLYSLCFTKKTSYARRQWAIYLLAYLCLLRVDEVLKIDVRHLEMPFRQSKKIILTLDFRETHQEGGIKPFVLHRNDKLEWLCPVRAILKWFYLRSSCAEGIEKEGPFFCNVGTDSRLDRSTRLTYSSFLRNFHQDLQEAKIAHFSAYGTHSFRRGGTQWWGYYIGEYMEKDLVLPLVALINWGGWSQEYTALHIIRSCIAGWMIWVEFRRRSLRTQIDRLGSYQCKF